MAFGSLSRSGLSTQAQNPKYFGYERGVTYYNLVSDQFTGLNAIVVPGTLRDSLVLLAVVVRWYFTTFLPTHDKSGPAPSAGLAPTPLPPPIITVIAPSERERREAETRSTIRWKARAGSPDARIAGVGLELWKGDTRVESIAGGGTRAVREKQSFDWNVPATLKPGDQYRVKVTAWGERGLSGHGYSGAFSVLPSAESRREPPIEHSQMLAQEEAKTLGKLRLPKSLRSKKTWEKPLRKNMIAIVLGVVFFGAGAILAIAMIILPPKVFHPDPWISKLSFFRLKTDRKSSLP
jgi:hypothetical protein